MAVKDLKGKEKDIAATLKIDISNVNAIVELMEKAKIAKPGKLFKDNAPKLAVQGNKEFTYVSLGGPKKYFFYGVQLPLGKALATALANTEKALGKAKDKEKEGLELMKNFYTEMQNLEKKMKGSATGLMKFDTAKGNDAYMQVKQGVSVSGQVKKGLLAGAINNDLAYELLAKNGQVLKFNDIDEDDGVEAATQAVKDQVKKGPTEGKMMAKFSEIKVIVDNNGKKPTPESIELAKKWMENFKTIAQDASDVLKKRAEYVSKIAAAGATREQGGAPQGDDKATQQLNQLQKEIDDLIKQLGGAEELKKMAGL